MFISPFEHRISKKTVPLLAALTLVTFSFFAGFGGALLAIYAPPSFVANFLGSVDVVSPAKNANDNQAGAGNTPSTTIYIPQTSQEDQVISVVKKASTSVVSVVATKDVPAVSSPFFNDPFFKQFFPNLQVPQDKAERRQISAGTGFIISEDGLVLTNKHVVADEAAEYTVITTDGAKFTAEVLARDPLEDLAILKATGLALPPLPLGNSDMLQQGQTVIAIGNALGEFENTISTGVVSGLRRSIEASGASFGTEQLRELIQTDAAINPGNSGGPLLNLQGNVIGVNVARAQNAENIGFAIPINRAKRDIESIRTKGVISFPFLGVRTLAVDEDLQLKNNLSVDYGALVSRGQQAGEVAVLPGSAADIAGIVENDIILEIDGKRVTKENPLAYLINAYEAGDSITIKLLHKGVVKTVTAVLGERKS